MKLKTLLKIVILLVSFYSPMIATAMSMRNDSILTELDRIIDQKESYSAPREKRIEQFKRDLNRVSSLEKRYQLCDSLYNIYMHYQADSAYHYVQMQLQLLSQMGHLELKNEVLLHLAGVMGVMGLYDEAYKQLQQVDQQQLDSETRYDYYCAYRAYYGWIGDYASLQDVKRQYKILTNSYRDSLLMSNSPALDRVINRVEQRIEDGESSDSSLMILNNLLTQYPTSRELAYIYFTLSNVYESMGDLEQQIFYLAQTAIVDLQSSVREYASLQKLAVLMYQSGSIGRAYRYLSCSMEDAVACNARLRFVEVTNLYPIIDKAYQEQMSYQHRITRYLLIGISILALFLVGAFFYLYFTNKKLITMRARVNRTNQELLHVNQALSQTNNIKDVYIGRYLDRCVSYLDKLDTYRRSLLKLSMAARVDDLFKAIKSEQFIQDEKKSFYQEFDKSFLELFPHFIEDFNKLLEPESRITPKSSDLLTTELRIFALIRLGVTDSNNIAHFLSYSLATIYNYRSKIRNKAIGNKEQFEQEVMKL